jgi:hypothetical protein
MCNNNCKQLSGVSTLFPQDPVFTLKMRKETELLLLSLLGALFLPAIQLVIKSNRINAKNFVSAFFL